MGFFGNNSFVSSKEELHKINEQKEKEITFEGTVFDKCDVLVDENGFVIKDSILFAYCKNEEEVIIPKGVIQIVENAFVKSQQLIIGIIK